MHDHGDPGTHATLSMTAVMHPAAGDEVDVYMNLAEVQK
jgi:hypothetical protein